MIKVKGPSILWLLIIIAVLTSIYAVMVYIIAKRPIEIEYKSKSINEVDIEYTIPKVLYTDDALFELSDNGMMHIYNDKCEIVMSDGNGDILEYTDPNGSIKVNSNLDKKVDKDIKIVAVRQFEKDGNGNTAVSYEYLGRQYGFIIVNETDSDKIAAYINDQVSLSR